MGLWARLKRTLRAERYENDIDEELGYHLALKQRDSTDPRSALISFGNPAKWKEDMRSEGLLVWLESLVRDVRQGLRQMKKTPLLTAAVVASLAIGIGANSAIFSLVDAAIVKPLPVPQPGSLRLILWTSHGWPDPICEGLSGGISGNPATVLQGSAIAPRIYRGLASRQTGFESLVGFFQIEKAGVAAGHTPAEEVNLQYVSADFFQSLGAFPAMGRAFAPRDDRVGEAPVAVISNRFWHSRFNGHSNILGQAIRINNVPTQIIGVAAPGFFGLKIGEWVDVYTPLGANVALSAHTGATRAESDGNWSVEMMARLRPGVPESAALQQLSSLFQRLVVPPGVHMRPDNIPALITSPGQRGFEPFGEQEIRALWILLFLVGLILLIVCANVANLLLSRSVARQREAAVCTALGASRIRLIRQYLVESLTLAITAALLGLYLSNLLASALHAWVRSELNIGGFDLHINWRLLVFTGMICLATAVLFGLAPAWQSAKTSVGDALKLGGRNVTAGRMRLPQALVVLQVALSLTVIFAAGLLTRSLVNLEDQNLGFTPHNVVYATMNPWQAGYTLEQVAAYVRNFRERLAAVPGVERTAVARSEPLSGDSNTMTVNIPGKPYTTDWADRTLVNEVSDGLLWGHRTAIAGRSNVSAGRCRF